MSSRTRCRPLLVRHRVENGGPLPLELAPWSITQLPLGGRALLPQRRAVARSRHAPQPGLRAVAVHVLGRPPAAGPGRRSWWWPPRGRRTSRSASSPTRAGSRTSATGQRSCGASGRPPGEAHSDLGCNVETYCGARYLELEILGPLTLLQPGETTVLTEHWELRRWPDTAAGYRSRWPSSDGWGSARRDRRRTRPRAGLTVVRGDVPERLHVGCGDVGVPGRGGVAGGRQGRVDLGPVHATRGPDRDGANRRRRLRPVPPIPGGHPRCSAQLGLGRLPVQRLVVAHRFPTPAAA